MSSLKHIDRVTLERYFDMGGGYVCDFSNRTFADFIVEATGVDIYDSKYDEGSGSKANRLRAYWRVESDAAVARLLKAMLEYWKRQKVVSSEGITQAETALHEECEKIAAKLSSSNTLEDAAVFDLHESDDSAFTVLVGTIKESVEKGEPSQALDRVHTFVVRWMRKVCERHAIEYDREVSLTGLFSRYVKYLEDNGKLDSEMARRIIRSAGSWLDAFNTVRNNQSLAHDNPLLSNRESKLILNSVASVLRFIKETEDELSQSRTEDSEQPVAWDDLEFSKEEIESAGDRWMQEQEDIRRGK